jgi:hypothetical protein
MPEILDAWQWPIEGSEVLVEGGIVNAHAEFAVFLWNKDRIVSDESCGFFDDAKVEPLLHLGSDGLEIGAIELPAPG